MNFTDQLQLAWQRTNSLLCVGLDPEPSRFPATLRDDPDAIFTFCRAVVDACVGLACCFKPQFAHFAAHRAEASLERLIAYIHATCPGIPVILDAKRGDIGSTARHYATEAYERYRADAVTLNPYLGRDAVQPFLDRADKGAIILCHTSNPGASDLQELQLCDANGVQRRLYQHVAARIACDWNANGNCALVVGATYPQELADVRQIVGDNMPLLIPGIGAQGGDIEAVVRNGKNSNATGLLISVSRALLYASNGADYADAARVYAQSVRDEINCYR